MACTVAEVFVEAQARAAEMMTERPPREQHPIHAAITLMLCALAVGAESAVIHQDAAEEGLFAMVDGVNALVKAFHVHLVALEQVKLLTPPPPTDEEDGPGGRGDDAPEAPPPGPTPIPAAFLVAGLRI